MHLLDINVLLARCDRGHTHHEIASDWFTSSAAAGWNTCPLTENGFIRILSHPSYPNTTGSSERARQTLQSLIRAIPGHTFLPADLSLLTPGLVPDLMTSTSKQLTDFYLLALAARHNVRFVTFDQHIDDTKVAGGPQAYAPLPS